MRKITRRKRLLSLFTMVILITSTAWTSFAYADSEGIDQGVPNQLVQELSSEEAPIMPAEETPELNTEENIEQVVGEAVIEQAPAMAPMIELAKPVKITDPDPNTGNGTEPTNPRVGMNGEPVVGKCLKSENMFKDLKNSIESWGDIEITITKYSTDYGQKFNFTATKSGEPVKLAAVYVKGGSEVGYLYDYTGIGGAWSDTGLHAPKNKSNKYAGVSHLVFYYCPPVVVVEKQKQITVEKVWKDQDGNVITDTAELPEVTVKIDFTDPAFEDKTLKLNYDNGWTDKVENILASRVYTIVEEAVTGLPEGYEIKKTDITGECIDPEMDRKIHEDRDIKCMHTVANTIGEEDEFEGRISGIKFNDLDKDGVHDENEPGLEGVTIYLYNVNPSEVSEAQPATSAVTDENGEFSFTVAAGSVKFDMKK